MDIVKTYCIGASLQVEQANPGSWEEQSSRKRKEYNLGIITGQDSALVHGRTVAASLGAFVISAVGSAGCLGE